jgi:GAF domain-containing protein
VKENERLAAVRRYDILNALPDRAFDRITALAARLLNAPIAIVSIVDHDRIWFKSRHGIGIEYVERDLGLCASCVLQESPWLVSDARSDARARANPLVAGDAGIQFYLGIPLRTHDGFNLGALCVLDFVPRGASEADIAYLKNLAALVIDELELRLSARRSLASYHEELARRELREDHIKGLLRELAHRAKNLLAVIQAIARQTAPEDAPGCTVGRTLRWRELRHHPPLLRGAATLTLHPRPLLPPRRYRHDRLLLYRAQSC